VTVTIKLFATLRLKLGRGDVTVNTEGPVTIGALLDTVGERVGMDVRPYLLNDDGSLQVGTMILVDGKNIHHLNGLDTVIGNGAGTADGTHAAEGPESAEISIFPPAGGG
jgi:molybdopterin synthase sulfur carrier subunit